ncbi:MAG: hypothetical protein KME04_11805 [Pleurocapsa minor GSE-CHR-MK-17-07R]|jgi:uncharacterized protein YraI|nr:hypothetical protein [Pleurocapsa minor GSE-CHR-MK 17-07R]
MKRLVTLAVAALCLTAALPAFAQTAADPITLNDASPAIDVVITLPADTTGAVSLDLNGASVRLTDATGAVVFRAADARLHGLELNIAPNSGSHTLTVERLPGVVEAYVRVQSLAELSLSANTTLVDRLSVSLNEEVSLPLTTDRPGDTVLVNLPGPNDSILTTTFPGTTANTQVVDANGIVISESTGGHVDGMAMLLQAGDYQVTLVGSNLAGDTAAGISVLSADAAGFTVIETPEVSGPVVTPEIADACNATLVVSSANLRSGPGTGYSVLDYAYRDQVLPVGGRNPEGNWAVVGGSTGSAWISMGNVVLNGNCASLSVFNIPLLDAQSAPLIITSGTQTGTYNGDDDDDDDYEESEEHQESEDEHESEDDD